VGPGHEVATFRSVQLVGLSARVAMVVAVLSNGSVENEPVELADDADEARIGAASAHLARHLGGTPANAMAHTLPPTGDATTDALVEQAMQALHRRQSRESEQVYVGGAASMARAFDAVEVVRNVLTTLEQQYVVVSLLHDVLNRGLSVAIGAEHGVEPLMTCSVVVAPYVVDGEPVGTVGILGPTRMNYPQALAAVETVSERLSERLSDGG
ncbi:MAG TPA: HrcA family transcriptional regulator, partial [Acidimicrobiales bacterium]